MDSETLSNVDLALLLSLPLAIGFAYVAWRSQRALRGLRMADEYLVNGGQFETAPPREHRGDHY